ncbi:MAG TPA: ATP-binding protein [Thermoanaerobaculaceae bacterium]|nr:ATP-binding protein [Thermoanaerobaculaceae bacterium]
MARRRFRAPAEGVAEILQFVLPLAEAAGIEATRLGHLELAVEEWVVNVGKHAYRERPGAVEVAVRRDASAFVVELEDEGPPFDPTAAPAPDVGAPLEARRPGGLGILLIRRLLDGVGYERRGRRNVLTLVVNRPV